MQNFVFFLDFNTGNDGGNVIEKGSFTNSILNEDSRDISGEDEIDWFICVTSNEDKKCTTSIAVERRC